MTTPASIKLSMLKALDREGDTTLDEDLWFEFAHRDIQRIHNFQCMWAEMSVDLTLGALNITWPAPTNYKDSIFMYLAMNDATRARVQTFTKVGYENIMDRHLRLNNLSDTNTGNFDSAVYAIRSGNNVVIGEALSAGITATTHVLNLVGWKFLDPPADDGSDWFTDNARDYLIYRGLIESVPYLGASSEKLAYWSGNAERAMGRVTDMDIAAYWSGPLQIPG